LYRREVSSEIAAVMPRAPVVSEIRGQAWGGITCDALILEDRSTPIYQLGLIHQGKGMRTDRAVLHDQKSHQPETD